VFAAVCVAIAGAAQAAAQDPRVRRDSIADTTAARRDSIARAEAERQRLLRLQAMAADTIKAPLARADVPRSLGIGEPYTWDRNRLPATGALTLGELVDRVPGVTSFRSGWISAPEMAALNGRFGRVRIFLDGVELDPLNSRLRGQHDLSLIDLWHLEDATIETGARPSAKLARHQHDANYSHRHPHRRPANEFLRRVLRQAISEWTGIAACGESLRDDRPANR
jgi:outer membrane receptor protein involved in Fe transport